MSQNMNNILDQKSFPEEEKIKPNNNTLYVDEEEEIQSSNVLPTNEEQKEVTKERNDTGKL